MFQGESVLTFPYLPIMQLIILCFFYSLQHRWFESDRHGLCNELRLRLPSEFQDDGSGSAPVPFVAGPDVNPFTPLEHLICKDQSSQFANLCELPPLQNCSVEQCTLTLFVPCTFLCITDDRYSKGFLEGDDRQFKDKFCQAYQAMSMIGMQVPKDVKATSKRFIML